MDMVDTRSAQNSRSGMNDMMKNWIYTGKQADEKLFPLALIPKPPPEFNGAPKLDVDSPLLLFFLKKQASLLNPPNSKHEFNLKNLEEILSIFKSGACTLTQIKHFEKHFPGTFDGLNISTKGEDVPEEDEDEVDENDDTSCFVVGNALILDRQKLKTCLLKICKIIHKELSGLLDEFKSNQPLYDAYKSSSWFTNQKLMPTNHAFFRRIGRGGFGYVHAACLLEVGLAGAIKVMDKRMVKGMNAKSVVKNEYRCLELLSTYKHPFCISMYSSFSTTDGFYFNLELGKCTTKDTKSV